MTIPIRRHDGGPLPLRLALAARDPKRAAKHWLGRAVYAAGLQQRALSGRAMVTCFHAINDDHASPIACTRAEFRAWLDFFADHFEVIGLEALLDRLATGADVSNALVITFDDGYLDNHAFAAPELVRRGMTATFFVASSFINSNHQAWWDSDCGIRSRWMTWDHIRELHRAGFSIGAHTRTHADLGACGLDAAIDEIEGSVADIATALGARPTLFAYPFGGVDNMTPAVRGWIRGSGLRCCPSSYGGLVGPQTDPFDLPRLPITTWYRSPYQMGIEALRMRDGVARPHQARARPDA